jgi:hypothetical protein
MTPMVRPRAESGTCAPEPIAPARTTVRCTTFGSALLELSTRAASAIAVALSIPIDAATL